VKETRERLLESIHEGELMIVVTIKSLRRSER